MTQQLQDILQAARTLSAEEKRELLDILSHDSPLAEASAAFWASPSLDELAKHQAVPMVTDIRTLAVDFWPEDESAEAFNQFVAERRRSDRMSGA